MRAACQDTLRRLRLSRLDLYLAHSPFTDVAVEDTWRELEALVDEGLVARIGVSNYQVDHLRRVLAIARIRPVVNQIEVRRAEQRERRGARVRSAAVTQQRALL